jgi:hypothetical protein
MTMRNKNNVGPEITPLQIRIPFRASTLLFLSSARANEITSSLPVACAGELLSYFASMRPRKVVVLCLTHHPRQVRVQFLINTTLRWDRHPAIHYLVCREKGRGGTRIGRSGDRDSNFLGKGNFRVEAESQKPQVSKSKV